MINMISAQKFSVISPLLEESKSFCIIWGIIYMSVICKVFCSQHLHLTSHLILCRMPSYPILLQPHWPPPLWSPKLFFNAVLVCIYITWNTVQLYLHAWHGAPSRSLQVSLPMAPCSFTLSCFLQFVKNTVIFGLSHSLCSSPWNYAPWGCILHVQHCTCTHKTYCLEWMEIVKCKPETIVKSSHSMEVPSDSLFTVLLFLFSAPDNMSFPSMLCLLTSAFHRLGKVIPSLKVLPAHPGWTSSPILLCFHCAFPSWGTDLVQRI